MKMILRMLAILLTFSMLILLASCGFIDGHPDDDEQDRTWSDMKKNPDSAEADLELNKMIQNGPAQGHWEMFDARIENPMSNFPNATYTAQQTVHTYTFDYKAEPDVMGDEDFHTEFVATCTPPADVYYPGDVVSIHVKVEETVRIGDPDRVSSFSCNAFVDDWRKVDDPKLMFTRENGDYDESIYSLSAGVGQRTDLKPVKSMEDTFSFTLPTTQKESQYRFYIYFHSEAGDSVWAYQWIAADDMKTGADD